MAQFDQSVDGQRLSDQSAETQAAYAAAYGGDATTHWRDDHNRGIGFGGDPNSQYVTNGGTKSITDIGIELRNAGYPGPWDEGNMIAAYGRASGKTPVQTSKAPPPVHTPAPTQPFSTQSSGSGGGRQQTQVQQQAPVTSSGFQQWWFGHDFSQTWTNGDIASAGGLGFLVLALLSGRRR